MVIPEPEHQDHTLHSLESRSVDHVLDWVDLKMEDRQEDLGILVCLVCLDPFVKLRIVDMLKCTTHTLA